MVRSGALLTINFLNGFMPGFGQSFNLFQISGTNNLLPFLSTPGSFQVTGLPSGYLYSFGNEGGSFSLTTNSDTPVPEPGTWLLLGSGLIALMARRRRSARRALAAPADLRSSYAGQISDATQNARITR